MPRRTMPKKRKKGRRNSRRGGAKPASPPSNGEESGAGLCSADAYAAAAALAEAGDQTAARQAYEALERVAAGASYQAILCNDRAVLAVLAGNRQAALDQFREALAVDASCEPARLNLALLESEPADAQSFTQANHGRDAMHESASADAPPIATEAPIRVAVLSFLFNWPSTGGGIVHTVELVQFLAKAGYEVRHFYARYDPWEIGRVAVPVPF
jgi:hypothetical protein